MKLSIIIPTFNRAKLLSQTLQSILDSKIPADLKLEIIVVNNNSDDETEKIVLEQQKKRGKVKLKYLCEIQQGRSFAVNTGIREADGDLISMIDDDIQISPDWLVEVERIFRERSEEIDFVGGKVLPIWEIEPPEWVTEIKDVGICWRDYGEEEWKYGKDTPIVTGGHAVFKAEVFGEVGLYSEELGPKGGSLIGCEDDVMFDKLIEAKKQGIYSPKLIVYHYVPAYRLSKNYYRQWSFGAGMSWDMVEIHYKKYDGAKILRVPRYLYRNALSSLFKKIKYFSFRKRIESLKSEKDMLLWAGYFYSRNLENTWLDKPLKFITNKFINVLSR